MNKGLSFNDITLLPVDFSLVRSRKDVNPTENILGQLKVPMISSNMSSVFSVELAKEVIKNGGISVVHRFCTIEANVKMFTDVGSINGLWGSLGVGEYELQRAVKLYEAGCHVLVLDVANAASIHVVDQYKRLKQALPNAILVVGNFGSANQIKEFIYNAGSTPDYFKCGIGNGAACSTRQTAGIGIPSVTSLIDCVSSGYPIIWDGGGKTTGDYCKAIALGAKAVMMGRNFAACIESGAKTDHQTLNSYKLYSGSASQSSYVAQGKTDYYRAPEGEEMWLTVTGTVKQLIQHYDAALRSSMSYLGAFTLEEFRKNAKWIEISQASQLESTPFVKDIK